MSLLVFSSLLTLAVLLSTAELSFAREIIPTLPYYPAD